MTSPALLATALTVRYGGVHAVREVRVEVPGGALVGLIGPNGSGKTSLIDAVSGFTPYTGSIELLGRPIDKLKPHQRTRAGLGRTFQGGELFDDLTVYENIAAAVAQGRLGSGLSRRGLRERTAMAVEAMLQTFELQDVAGALPSTLSPGRRRQIGLARAFVQKPRVALLDEPVAGLDTAESVAAGARIRTLVNDDTAVLIVDHDVGLVLEICDVIYVLNFGEVLAMGTPAAIRQDPRVIDAYLGAREVEHVSVP